VTDTLAAARLQARIEEMLALRTDANQRFFADHASSLAHLCHEMAERFAGGARLLAFGSSPTARSDAHHVAVEFVHPVIVGKRALPALAITGASDDLDLIARAGDILIAFDAPGRAVAHGGDHGCLTIAFEAAGADWEFEPLQDDPYIRQELVETLYHVLWELVHVFFEHRAQSHANGGAAGFLYPFLAEGGRDVEAVVEDVRRSVSMKAEEIGALRRQTLTDNRATLIAAANDLRAVFDRGGKLLAIGNGGSATDAMDVVADFRAASTVQPRRPALDLTEDSAILTAIANDIGAEAMFSRQVIAYGDPGDALVALSTSGSSANVIAALAEARRRGLETIALVGYDGGRIAQEALAAHVIVTRSEHIPRIQEAQASACHVLRELVELAGVAGGRG